MATRREFLKIGAGAAGFLGTSTVPKLNASQEGPKADRGPRNQKKPRLIYNDDGGSVVLLPHRVPMSGAELTDVIDQLRGTQVDRYVYCLGNGRVALHDSQVADRAWELARGQYLHHVHYRYSENARHLVESGFDPPAALGKRARETGIEYFLNLRMNDAHFAYSREGPGISLMSGTFWHKHPEVRIGGDGYQRHLFDYSREAVREFRLAYLSEVLTKYDSDGFELDFMRHPFFFPVGEGRKRAGVMTDFVRDVRKLLNDIGREKGKELQLGVLVPRTLDSALEIGLDVKSWANEQLVDLIVPKHYILFNMDVAVEEFLKLTSGTSIRVAPCLEQRQNVSDEKFRAAASKYWETGVDGLYLYNFFNHQPHPLSQEDRNILQEIGDPDLIRLRDKHYFVLSTSKNDLADEVKPIPLKLDIRPQGHTISLVVGDDLTVAAASGQVKEVTLKLAVPGITPETDEWDVHLNGNLVPHRQQQCLPDPVAFSERWIELNLTAGPYPKPGKNEIRLYLRKRNPLVKRALELTNVELVVKYH